MRRRESSRNFITMALPCWSEKSQRAVEPSSPLILLLATTPPCAVQSWRLYQDHRRGACCPSGADARRKGTTAVHRSCLGRTSRRERMGHRETRHLHHLI